MKSSQYQHIFKHVGSAVITAVLFGSIGTYFLRTSSAATYSSDPVGSIDYCALEGSNTVLYGWAYDPEAPRGVQPYVVVTVGNTAATLASDQTYREAQVNDWIDTQRPGAPKPGLYGFRLQLTGLYKGNSYPVSGQLLNYGAGANAAIGVNQNIVVDGDTSKNLFTGGKVPDACLTTKPAPLPTPTPTPTPKPTPVPKPSVPKTTAPPATAPAAPTLSNAADATVTVGSTVATASVPAGNASSIYVRYGTEPSNLNRSSDIQTISGAAATIKLEKLTGKTTYTYQIVRTQGSQTTTSANATFSTKGYTVSLLFTDASGKPVSNISTQLGNNKPVKSDSNGTVSFKNLSSGSYSPIFTYNGQSYSENFSTSSEGKEAEDGTLLLSKTVDLSKLRKSAQSATNTETNSGRSKLAFAPLILLLALIGGGLWWALRRKRRLLAEAYGYAPTDYVPPVVVNNPAPQLEPEPTAVVEAVAHHNKAKKQPGQPTPAPVHMGESLRDMVLQSMAEDAVKHPEHHNKKPPIVPGG